MNSDQPETRWNKAERLAVAGAVAPSIRSQELRRVARVDSEGNIVGYSTLAEVQASLLKRHEIEIEVTDGVRPKEWFCEKCGLPCKVRHRQTVPRCERCTFLKCADCGKAFPRCYSAPSMQRRGHKEKVCRPCMSKRVAAAKPRCAVCNVAINVHLRWQYRKRWGESEPLRCGPCLRKHHKLPVPTCSVCFKELSVSSRRGKRAREGKPLFCPDCYRGEVRSLIAKEKIAKDPVFAEKVKKAMTKGHELQSKLKRKAQTPTCFLCVGGETSKGAMSSRSIAKRKGAPPKCLSCNAAFAREKLNEKRKRAVGAS